MQLLILTFPNPGTTSLKVEGNPSSSMKMLIIKLGKRRNVMIGTEKHLKESIIVSTHGLEIKPSGLAKKAIRDFKKLIAKEAKSNPKALYNYVNSKTKTRVIVSDFINDINSTVASNDKEKAYALNIFFSSVFTQEDLQNIPAVEDICENFLSSVDLSDKAIMVKFKKCKHNKSLGPDGIHPRILKELSNKYLLVPLRILFTRSLSEGVLPNSWKINHVIPIFKGGKRSCASNYRPVSLTCIIGKMLELLICDAIIKYLIDNNLLVECQHGFIQGRSCVTQLLKIMDTWTEILDEGYYVDVAYLYYRKAFDSVPYERILIKLEGYGVKNPILGWIRNFLIGRSQKVVSDSAKSKWAPVTNGIPQGSGLRPALFIIYINDLPDTIHSSIQMFAYDTKVFNTVACSSNCEELQRDIDSLVVWSVAWQLKFNTAKCKIMHIGGSNPHQIYSM